MGELYQNDVLLTWTDPNQENMKAMKTITLSTFESEHVGQWEFPKKPGKLQYIL